MTQLRLACVFSLLLALLTLGQAPSAPAPASVPVAWHLQYPSPAHFTLGAISERHLWFYTIGRIVQYDMQRKLLIFHTAAAGLPLNTSRVQNITSSAQGQALVMMVLKHGPRLFLHDDTHGWRTVPDLPQGLSLADARIDAQGHIYALANSRPARGKPRADTCSILQLIDGRWRIVREAIITGAYQLIPLEDAWLIRTHLGKQSQMYRLDHASLGADPVLVHDFATKHDSSLLRTWHHNGHVYIGMALERTPNPSNTYTRLNTRVYELTRQGVVEHPMDGPVHLDLQAGKFVPLQWEVMEDKTIKATFSREPLIERVMKPYEIDLFPLRDAHGQLWQSTMIWRQGQWHPWTDDAPLRQTTHTTDRSQSTYNPTLKQWVNPVTTDQYRYYNIDRYQPHLVWARPTDGRPMIDLLDLSNQSPRIIRQVPWQNDWSLPLMQDHQGSWWFLDRSRWLNRLDPDGSVHLSLQRKIDLIQFRPQLQALWARQHSRHYRYDFTTMKWEEHKLDQMLDELAFEVGGSTWALLESLTPGYFSDHRVARKTSQGWEYLDFTHVDRRGDRFLLSSGRLGVWEFDAVRHRWVQLHSDLFHVRFLDDHRRVLANHYAVMLIEGDPFENPAYQSLQTLTHQQEQLLSTMTQLLSSGSPAVRDYVLSQLPPPALPLLPQYWRLMEHPNLPESQRELWGKAIKTLMTQRPEANPFPSQFEVMYPAAPMIEPSSSE